MRRIWIQNLANPNFLPLHATVYSRFWDKLRGLMFKKTMGDDDSILIDQGLESRINSAIHMLFMNFEITVVWINSQQEVVDVKVAKPWMLACVPQQPARYILETHLKLAESFKPGDELVINYE